MNSFNTSVGVRISLTRTFGFAAAAALAISSSVSADIINIGDDPSGSQHGLGEFFGTIEYLAGLFGTTGTLKVSLTNSSDPDNGGFLTGFLFNINSTDAAATASLSSASHPMQGVTNEPGNPFGTYDAGAALGGNFLGGGSPVDGIGVGDTGIFEFLVSASDAGSLTASSFITGPFEYNFLTRFRGFLDEESDTVPGQQVPTPGALGLLLAAGLIGTRRRR